MTTLINTIWIALRAIGSAHYPRGIEAPASQLLGLPDGSVNSQAVQTYIRELGVGVNPACYIPRMEQVGGQAGSLGNIANLILCGLAVLIGIGLALAAVRRAAAVGRLEMAVLFVMYALVQGAQLADNSGLLRQGSLEIVWVTAVHVGLIVSFFWVLVWVAFLSLQIVEDGTLASLIPMFLFGIVLTIGTGYVALDNGLTVTDYFQSNPPQDLHSIWLFVFLIIWPAAAAALYFLVQIGVVLRVLKEKKPLILFTAAAFIFILSQGAYFALSYKICTGTSRKVDGSFLATLLETVTMVLIYFGWRSITEDSWDGVAYMD
ncbi:hypothetical protein OIO90_006241 [Microbotryomycetes sp. JL221]|nr:hypothetical protein OIO90_006241 [Microbotryomycetes sp. JL221]